jgi:hypothetical protein
MKDLKVQLLDCKIFMAHSSAIEGEYLDIYYQKNSGAP